MRESRDHDRLVPLLHDQLQQVARDFAEALTPTSRSGPPFSYAAGLDEARANLSAVGAPEPDGLDGFELGESFPECSSSRPRAPG